MCHIQHGDDIGALETMPVKLQGRGSGNCMRSPCSATTPRIWSACCRLVFSTSPSRWSGYVTPPAALEVASPQLVQVVLGERHDCTDAGELVRLVCLEPLS